MSPDSALEVGEGIPIIPELLHSTVPVCSCPPNINRSYEHGKYRLPLLVTDSERTERGQSWVLFFNHTRLKIRTKDRSYDQGDFLHSHACIMLMLGLLVDDVLFLMRPQLWGVQLNMERAHRKEKKADNF